MIKNHTGKDLRALRIENGLTQKDAADIFLVSRGTYSSWESRYKNKKLPTRVIKDEAFWMMLIRSPFISKKNIEFKQAQETKTKKGFIEWLKTILKNLFK